VTTHEIRLDETKLRDVQKIFWDRKRVGVSRGALPKTARAGDHVLFRCGESAAHGVITNMDAGYELDEIAVRAAKEGEF
jgi:hypothetical protein